MSTPTGERVPFYVAIAGNIGVGKTMVCDLIAEKLGWDAYYEPVVDNPYLEDFYADMRRFSFHLQVFFLSKRFALQRTLLETGRSAVNSKTDALGFGPEVRRFLRVAKNRGLLAHTQGLKATHLGAQATPLSPAAHTHAPAHPVGRGAVGWAEWLTGASIVPALAETARGGGASTAASRSTGVSSTATSTPISTYHASSAAGSAFSKGGGASGDIASKVQIDVRTLAVRARRTRGRCCYMEFCAGRRELCA